MTDREARDIIASLDDRTKEAISFILRLEMYLYSPFDTSVGDYVEEVVKSMGLPEFRQ